MSHKRWLADEQREATGRARSVCVAPTRADAYIAWLPMTFPLSEVWRATSTNLEEGAPSKNQVIFAVIGDLSPLWHDRWHAALLLAHGTRLTGGSAR